MRLIIIILISLISLIGFSQIDSLEVEVMYIGNINVANRVLDSVDAVNGYPRQGAITYMGLSYNTTIDKYGVEMNKVAEKYLARMILQTLEFPTLRIPISSLNTSIETQVLTIAYNYNWNIYIKNNNLWMFNYNRSADDNFTQNQINWVLNNGGQLWNFD